MRSRSSASISAFWWALARLVNGNGGQVAGQANAAGDDDVGLRPGAAQPFATGMSQAIQIHPWLPFVGAGRVDGRPLRRPPRRRRARSCWRRSHQFGLQGGVAHGSARGTLPTCRPRAVDALQERLQAGAEDLVIVRAAEPALGPELHILYAARRAGQSRQLVASGPTCWPISVCRMAGRFSSCCLSSCCFSAQAWHRCSFFFCAR